MRTYLLEGRFLPHRPQGAAFGALLKEHHQYLAGFVADGSVLFCGPVTNDEGCGGIIVVKTDDVEAFCQGDPFVQNGVQEYRVLAFRLFDGQPGAKAWGE